MRAVFCSASLRLILTMKRRGREVTRSSLTPVQWPALWVCRSISLLRWQLRETVVVTYWIWLIRLRRLTLILLVSGCLWCHVQWQLGPTAQCWELISFSCKQECRSRKSNIEKVQFINMIKQKVITMYMCFRYSGSKSSLYFSLTTLLQEVWNVYSSNSQKYSLVLR